MYCHISIPPIPPGGEDVTQGQAEYVLIQPLQH